MAKTNRNTSTASVADTMSTLSEAFETAQAKMEVPAAARDLVKRSATAAQEQAEKMHEAVASATARGENLATAAIGNYADFSRGMFEASLANVRHALATVEKVAGASSLNEVVQIQSDYVRESARDNYERAREAAETARLRFADSTKALQDEIATMVSRNAA